jgi:hypothetical protein
MVYRLLGASHLLAFILGVVVEILPSLLLV